VAVLVVLVRRHCHAVRAAVRRAVDDEISSAIKEETGPAALPFDLPHQTKPFLLVLLVDHSMGIQMGQQRPLLVLCYKLKQLAEEPATSAFGITNKRHRTCTGSFSGDRKFSLHLTTSL